MFENINMFVKITCDNCGFSQTELEPESNDKFFNSGWSMNNNAKKIKAKYLLLDRIKRGEGDMVDFKNAAKLASKFPIFLAGGLTPDNIAKAITNVRPFAVDVAGGIETNGFQDLEKLKLFIKNAKGVIL